MRILAEMLFMVCITIGSRAIAIQTSDFIPKDPLLNAVVRGDLGQVTKLLASKPGFKSKEAAQALVTAAGYGRVGVVRLLILKGTNPNSAIADGSTALMYASSATTPASKAIITELLKHGAKVDVQDKKGATALMGAARSGNIPAIRLLLDHQSNPNIRNKAGHTAADYAASESRDEVVALLSRATSRTEKNGLRLELLRAVKSGNIPRLRELLRRGGSIEARDDEGNTLLIIAATSGREKVIELLITQGANIEAKALDYWKYTALIVAADHGHVDTITVLLSKGANCEARSTQGYTPLMRASMQNHYDCITVLLNAGADVNAEDEHGDTPILSASSPEVVRLLMKRGANINKRNKDGTTALIQACGNGLEAVVEALLKYKPDLKIKAYGQTALTVAMEKRFVKIAQMLREAGAK